MDNRFEKLEETSVLLKFKEEKNRKLKEENEQFKHMISVHSLQTLESVCKANTNTNSNFNLNSNNNGENVKK